MEINGIELNEKVISEQGMLYYLSECTDFLCDLPEWMYPHIEAELADKKSMHQYYEEAKGNTIEEEVEKTHPCFNANDGHENGTGDCTNLVAIPGQICCMECAMSSAEKIINEDAEVKPSKTWIGDGYDPLLTIIIHEVEGIPEIAFAGSNELAEKVWNKMMLYVAKNREEIAMADPHTELTPDYSCHSSDDGVHCLHDSWDEGFFHDDDDIYRVEYKTLNGADYAGEGIEVADGDKIRAIRPGTKMPVTILTSIHSGIPETWFVGSEEEAKKEWEQAMLEIEGRRENRAERDGEEPDYTCDYSDDGERTTKNAWDAGYFCDHKDEYRIDGYSVEVA